jgi:hypothetical protein
MIAGDDRRPVQREDFVRIVLAGQKTLYPFAILLLELSAEQKGKLFALPDRLPGQREWQRNDFQASLMNFSRGEKKDRKRSTI